ncbi:EVE domain-containing protein [Planktothricoides raciborskii]|uniref:EVE domain-containing protein n=1 Tax=Planktothricoides raciborskii TaxID=132608 RepID=UPI001F55393C|nr:EVE domain-containing protein [Planktothricoides raciborskii]
MWNTCLSEAGVKLVAYWLLKTEPEQYSYQDLLREGCTIWDGVKNNLALKYMATMNVGDLGFIYHTGGERRVTAIVAEVVSQPYPDPNFHQPKWLVVDLRSRFPMPQTVTLAQIKAQPELSNCDLIRLPRLSIVPLSLEHWQKILTLGHVEGSETQP